MGISNNEIYNVVAELRPALLKGRIQKIHQHSEYGLTLQIRGKGKSRFLHCSIHPSLSRIHLIEQKYENPPKALPFCMFLRKHITGALIESINQVNQDRIVTFKLTRGTMKYDLIVELFGRPGNIILVDGDGKILMTAIKTDKDVNRLKLGNTYNPPKRSHSSRFSNDKSDLSGRDNFFLTKK